MELLIKLLPLILTLGNVLIIWISGRVKNVNDDEAEDINTRRLLNKTYEHVLEMYEGERVTSDNLRKRIEYLEGVVGTLQEQLNAFIGLSAYAVEGDHASFRG